MAWTCEECRSRRMTAVCHHCGKPLCDEHAVVIVDDALAEYDSAPPPREVAMSDRAVHCDDCHHQNHPRSQVVRFEHDRVGI